MISKPFTGYADHGISGKRRSTQSLDQVQVELKYMHLNFCRKIVAVHADQHPTVKVLSIKI